MTPLKVESDLIELIASKHSVKNFHADSISRGFSILDSHIIKVSNLEELTTEFVNVQFDLLGHFMKKFQVSNLLFQIEDHRRPDAAIRRVVIARLSELSNRISNIAFGNGKSSIGVTATKMMMSSTGIENFTIHEHIDQARAKLNELNEIS